MPGLGLLAAVVLCAASARPAAAVELAPSPSPLPGSAFQAADGDQAPAPALTDWSAVQDAGAVTHAPDPNAADDAFAAGAKEATPGAWDLTTEPGGVNPAQANIRDAWTVVDQPGARTFAYLAFAREQATGTTFVTFELNRDGRLWDNGRARIPCRRTGDVLISFEPHGKTVSLVVSRWTTTAADPGTGCATAGRLTDGAGLVDGVEVQGAPNAATIANALPGAYGETIPAGRFGEVGVDLAAVLAGAFGDSCLAYTSVWMHSRSSRSEESALQDYVAPRPLEARTCAAAGTKFFDRDADGTRDAGEPGLPRFRIFADYDGDGVLDPSEPYAVTDTEGHYVIDDIRSPGGSYVLREELLAGVPARDWRCSHPGPVAPGPLGCGWGPIAVAQEPYARDRDFGDWYPARLTLRKELYPSDDPGRFDLLVGDEVVVPAADDGAAGSRELQPGSYDVREAAVPPTDAADYVSAAECKRGTARPVRRLGPIALAAGERVLCTFRNVRIGAPAIAIDKTGPAVAPAGTTLRYRMYIENIGAVAFPAAAIAVADSRCDARPVVVDKARADGTPDASGGTLDPGDIWTYRCVRTTAAAGADCVPQLVPNTATATGSVSGVEVEDESTIATVLTCPETPEPSLPPDPSGAGQPPGAGLAPAGPTPPAAGSAGTAALSPLGRCLRRGSVVTIRGRRIASVRVFVEGRLVRGLRVRPLEDRAKIRLVRRFAPGRYRVRGEIRFARGAGTAPLTLVRRVRVCAPRPRFTG